MDLLHRVEDPRRRRRRAWVLDIVVLLAVVAISAPGLFAYRSPSVLTVTTFVLVILPILVRRIWPVPVLVACLVFAVVPGLFVIASVPLPPLLVALYTVAAGYPRQVALMGAGVLEAGVVLAAVLDQRSSWWVPALSLSAFVAAALGLGLYVGARRALLASLRDRATRLERERDQQGALAAAAERARISREMHDIVAHNLTVMVALADGAAAVSTRSPEQAAETMRTVSSTGRQALADTRRLLGLLRADDETVGTAPLPGLAELEELLATVRAAGLPVRHEIRGAVPELDPAAQLTLYRVVQEALTNTMKHAGPGVSASVRLDFSADPIVVEVVDDGRGTPVGPPGEGRGLAGMRERLAAFGGDIEAGPAERRGWRVRARLGLDHAATR